MYEVRWLSPDDGRMNWAGDYERCEDACEDARAVSARKHTAAQAIYRHHPTAVPRVVAYYYDGSERGAVAPRTGGV